VIVRRMEDQDIPCEEEKKHDEEMLFVEEWCRFETYGNDRSKKCHCDVLLLIHANPAAAPVAITARRPGPVSVVFAGWG